MVGGHGFAGSLTEIMFPKCPSHLGMQIEIRNCDSHLGMSAGREMADGKATDSSGERQVQR